MKRMNLGPPPDTLETRGDVEPSNPTEFNGNWKARWKLFVTWQGGLWQAIGAQWELRGQDSVRIRRRHETLAKTHTEARPGQARRMDGWMDEGGDGYRKPTCERKWNLGGNRKCYSTSSISAGKVLLNSTSTREKPLNLQASRVTIDARCDDSAHAPATQNWSSEPQGSWPCNSESPWFSPQGRIMFIYWRWAWHNFNESWNITCNMSCRSSCRFLIHDENQKEKKKKTLRPLEESLSITIIRCDLAIATHARKMHKKSMWLSTGRFWKMTN